MKFESTIERALVVLSPDIVDGDSRENSITLQRAALLAERTGCELELFHACYDSTLDTGLFTANEDLEAERRHLTDRDATRIEEIAFDMKRNGLKVTTEVCWDAPRTDAILRKIARSRPDVVLKAARESSYVLGLTTNVDWELARRSPAHVWLVNENVSEIDKIVAAVGNKVGDPADITTAGDYDLLTAACQMSDAFDAQVYPVNAYRAPNPTRSVADIVSPATPIVSEENATEAHADAIKNHSSAVKAIAEYFNIPRDNVQIREGQPDVVITNAAKSLSADLIVMGAESINRFERAISNVTVEPVVADSQCDVLVVRERDRSRVPGSSRQPRFGAPSYDVEQAITMPSAAFSSPKRVAEARDLSPALRRRILQAWEYDLRAAMVAENEGGSVREIDVGTLEAIQEAGELLDAQEADDDDMLPSPAVVSF